MHSIHLTTACHQVSGEAENTFQNFTCLWKWHTILFKFQIEMEHTHIKWILGVFFQMDSEYFVHITFSAGLSTKMTKNTREEEDDDDTAEKKTTTTRTHRTLQEYIETKTRKRKKSNYSNSQGS